MGATPYLPDIILNPAGSLIDLLRAYPFGVLSAWNYAPVGSKQDQIKAMSGFIPAKVTDAQTGEQLTMKQFTTKWIEASKTASPEAKKYWSEDTLPEAFPGQDWLNSFDWGKWLPIIIVGGAGVWLLGKYLGGKK